MINVGMIDLQVTHGADVNTVIRTAKERRSHDHRKTSSNGHRILRAVTWIQEKRT